MREGRKRYRRCLYEIIVAIGRVVVLLRAESLKLTVLAYPTLVFKAGWILVRLPHPSQRKIIGRCPLQIVSV